MELEWSDPDVRNVFCITEEKKQVQINHDSSLKVYDPETKDYTLNAVMLDRADVKKIAGMMGMKCIDAPFDGVSHLDEPVAK